MVSRPSPAVFLALPVALGLAVAAVAQPGGHPPLEDKDGHCGMYPPEVYRNLYAAMGDCRLRRVGERPLWKGLQRGYRQQIRFTFNDGHSLYTKVIDFAERADGRGVIEIKTIAPDGHRLLAVEDQRRAGVSAADVRRLNALAAAAGVWQFSSGSWDGEALYMHCETLDMERIDRDGYRFSNVNITCNRPNRLMPFVDLVAGLAGLKPDGLRY
jgi:hypothetical protein